MQTRKLFVLPVILGVLLAACRTSSSNHPVESVQPTQQDKITVAVIPTATAVAPTAVMIEAATESIAPVEPQALPMAIPSGGFQPGFPLAIPRTKHTATLLKNGKILVVGGSVEGDDFASDEEIIDPTTGTSRWAAPLHTFRHDHSATLLEDGRVLVIGGYNLPEQWIGDAEIYEPQTDVWTVIPPMYSHGSLHSATLLKDSRVLVVGGCIGSGVCTSQVEVFDPRTNQWTGAASLQADRWGQTSQLLDNGRVLVAGGITAAGDIPVDGSALIYDPANNTWAATQPMNTPRFYAESVKLATGDVLVAGGLQAGSRPPATTSSVEIYDPDTNTWRTVPSLVKARYAFTLKVLPDGQIIAIAGAQEWDTSWTDNSFVTEIELFDPAKEQWRVIGELPEPGAFSTGTQLNDGRIWIAGGQTGSRVLDENWLIQP